MSDITFPSPFQIAEGRRLSGSVPADFEQFYRLHLRFRSGSRIRAVEVQRRYAAWATEAQAQWFSLRAIKSAMASIGHRHLLSNGAFYADVQFTEVEPHLADNFPAPAVSSLELDQVRDRVAQIAEEVARIRAALGSSALGG